MLFHETKLNIKCRGKIKILTNEDLTELNERSVVFDVIKLNK